MDVESQTQSRVFVIRSEVGFHLRPASLFAKTVKQFDARITVHKGERQADGANILALMTLEALHGDALTVTAAGADAAAALSALEALFAKEFGG